MNVSKRMKDLITKLSPLRMAPNSAGLDKCTEYLCEELDFNVIEVEGGSEINGWIVPQKWEINRATIKNANGDLIYDGMHHPLAVIGYSQSFTGSICGKELKQHLAVAKQALNYIFKNVEKTKKAYNQAHMEIGKNNFSGFVLDDGILLICMYSYDMNQQTLSQYVEENPQAFNALTVQ